jgi:hypothetical protein
LLEFAQGFDLDQSHGRHMVVAIRCDPPQITAAGRQNEHCPHECGQRDTAWRIGRILQAAEQLYYLYC